MNNATQSSLKLLAKTVVLALAVFAVQTQAQQTPATPVTPYIERIDPAQAEIIKNGSNVQKPKQFEPNTAPYTTTAPQYSTQGKETIVPLANEAGSKKGLPVTQGDTAYQGSARNAAYWTRQDARALPIPQAGRITDGAIHQDYLAYDALQKRINGLKAEVPEAQYLRARAQCWLDVSFQEYTRNDRSSFVEESFLNARDLTESYEQGKQLDPKSQALSATNADNTTLNRAAKVATPLWLRAARFTPAQKNCRPVQAACAEVELAHASNEWAQGSEYHARPYLTTAERYIGEVESANCYVAPVVVAAAPVIAPVVVASPVVKSVPVMPSQVHFPFNLWTLSAASTAVLDKIAVVLKADPALKLRAIGQTDVRANNDYNLMLSLNRVSAVQKYLQSAGVLPGQVQVGFTGRDKPAVAGNTETAHQFNRRVVFELATGSAQAVLQPQTADVQPCVAANKIDKTASCPRVNNGMKIDGAEVK